MLTLRENAWEFLVEKFGFYNKFYSRYYVLLTVLKKSILINLKDQLKNTALIDFEFGAINSEFVSQ